MKLSHRAIFNFVAATAALWFSAAALRVRAAKIEFPPGLFSNREPLHVRDFHGKVLVLCFYDPSAPEGWGDPQLVRWLVGEMRDRPVSFVAVVPGETVEQVRTAPDDMPEIPAFADRLRIMEHRAGGTPSADGQWRYTILGPGGQQVGHAGEDLHGALVDIQQSVGSAAWSYRTKATPDRLNPAVDCLERQQFAAGARILQPLLSGRDPVISRGARNLYQTLESQAKNWAARAAGLETAHPIDAYDLYAKIAPVFHSGEVSRDALRSMRRLERLRIVRSELRARSEYRKLDVLINRRSESRRAIIEFSRAVASTYSGTPTATRASELASELELLPPPPAAVVLPAYMIRIDDFHGAAGYSLLYKVTPENIVVGSISDWRGVQPKEQYRAQTTGMQRARIAEFLRRFPVRQLRTSYVDPNVKDGFQRTFEVRITGRGSRRIVVANSRQADLERLLHEINRLLPEKLHVGTPQSTVGGHHPAG